MNSKIPCYEGDVTLRKELDRVFGRGKNKHVQQAARENVIPAEEASSKVFKADIPPPQRDPLHDLQIKLVNGETSVEEFNKMANAIISVRKNLSSPTKV